MNKSPEVDRKEEHENLMKGLEAVKAITEPTAKREALENLWAKFEHIIIVPRGLSFNLAYIENFPQFIWSDFLDAELQKFFALASGNQTKALECQIAINKASMFAVIATAGLELQSNLFLQLDKII